MLRSCVKVMKRRFSIYPNGSRSGICYLKENLTGKSESLETTDQERAMELLTARNEAMREPAHNLQKARIYMVASEMETTAIYLEVSDDEERELAQRLWENCS